jgi:hypothetical protein
MMTWQTRFWQKWWRLRDAGRSLSWTIRYGLPAPLRFDNLNFLLGQLQKQAQLNHEH